MNDQVLAEFQNEQCGSWNGQKFAGAHGGLYSGHMRLAVMILEARNLLEKGVPDKGKKLQVPSDCKARILRRAADTAPLHLEPGGEHDRVVDPKGNVLTVIPHGEPTPGVCRSIVQILNNPDKAAHMPRFRGQAVKESEGPLNVGDVVEVVRKGGDWWSEMRKGARFTVTVVSGNQVTLKIKGFADGNGFDMTLEPGGKPDAIKLSSPKFRRTLVVKLLKP